MEMEESVEEIMERRSKLIVEVAQIRKNYPQKLIHIDEKICAMEYMKRTLESLSIDKDVANYKKQRPNDDIAVRKFEDDAKTICKVLEDVTSREKNINERFSPKTDISVLSELCEVQERLRHMIKIQEQLAKEDPLIKQARYDYLQNNFEAWD